MRRHSHALLVSIGLACGLASGGCGTPLAAVDVLASIYKVAPPPGVRVVRWKAETLGMDPSFIWELAPADAAYIAALSRANGLSAPAKPDQRRPAWPDRWPRWWNPRKLNTLPTQFDNGMGPGLKQIWVDPEAGRIYVEFQGT